MSAGLIPLRRHSTGTVPGHTSVGLVQFPPPPRTGPSLSSLIVSNSVAELEKILADSVFSIGQLRIDKSQNQKGVLNMTKKSSVMSKPLL